MLKLGLTRSRALHARFLMSVVCIALLSACEGDDGSGGGGGAGSSGGGAGASGGGAGVGGGSSTCQPFAPCGGNIDGAWTVQDICIADAADLAGMAIDDPACSNLFVGAETGGSGTMTFQSGSATSSAVLTMDLHVVWTLPCLRAASGASSIDLTTTCANIDQNYAANPEFTAGSCMIVGQTCDCIVTAERAFDLGDSYTISGSDLMFAGDSSTTAYCVSGSTLRLSSMDGTASGTVTLTR
jgi:hypothetical protein